MSMGSSGYAPSRAENIVGYNTSPPQSHDGNRSYHAGHGTSGQSLGYPQIQHGEPHGGGPPFRQHQSGSSSGYSGSASQFRYPGGSGQIPRIHDAPIPPAAPPLNLPVYANDPPRSSISTYDSGNSIHFIQHDGSRDFTQLVYAGRSANPPVRRESSDYYDNQHIGNGQGGTTSELRWDLSRQPYYVPSANASRSAAGWGAPPGGLYVPRQNDNYHFQPGVGGSSRSAENVAHSAGSSSRSTGTSRPAGAQAGQLDQRIDPSAWKS